MTKANILSTCLLAALLAALAGCQILPRQGEAQARDSTVQARDSEAQARDREVNIREREAQQARDREAQQSRRAAQQAYERTAQLAYDREMQARDRKAPARDRHDEVGVDFNQGDIAAIRDYYRQGNQPDNPPGQSTKLRQGEAYPFGYTWRALPRDLESRLSPLPSGYIRINVGTDIGILDIRSRVVVDLLENLRAEAQASDRKVPARDRNNKARKDFSEDDIAEIRDFYKQGHQPGLTAGRIMKLRQGEAYPFGYTWRPLPSELEARLSPLPQGYIRVIVGTDIGILDIRTRVVADLVENLAG